MKIYFIIIVFLFIVSCSGSKQKTEDKVKKETANYTTEEITTPVGRIDRLEYLREMDEYMVDTISQEVFAKAKEHFKNAYKADSSLRQKKHFKFSNGKELKLTDHFYSDHQDYGLTYQCLGYIPGVAWYVVRYSTNGRTMEETGLLLNKQNGDVDTIETGSIISDLFVSPDFTYILSIDYNSEDPGTGGSFDPYAIGPSAIILLKKSGNSYNHYAVWRFDRHIISDLVWIDRKTLLMQVFDIKDQNIDAESRSSTWLSIRIK